MPSTGLCRAGWPRPTRVCLSSAAQLERLEEGQQGIGGSEAAVLGTHGRGAGERTLFGGEVGVQIHLCGLDGLVPQDECDDRAVNTGLEEVDGGSMPLMPSSA